MKPETQICVNSYFIQGLQPIRSNPLEREQGNQFSDLTLLPPLSPAGAPQGLSPPAGKGALLVQSMYVWSLGAQSRVDRGGE